MKTGRTMRERIVGPVADLLRQGVTPEKIGAAVALGLILGVFPVIGSTTVLCAVAAAGLGLNLPLIQLVNCAAYPLQLVLLIPMLQMGQRLFGAPALPLTLPAVFAMIRASMVRASMWHTVATLGAATGRAIVVWFLLSCLVAPALYLATVPALRSLGRLRGEQ